MNEAPRDNCTPRVAVSLLAGMPPESRATLRLQAAYGVYFLMNALKLNTYRVVDDAVERGVDLGWRRAHKHTDAPSPDVIRAAIADAIMLELSDVVLWPDP